MTAKIVGTQFNGDKIYRLDPPYKGYEYVQISALIVESAVWPSDADHTMDLSKELYLTRTIGDEKVLKEMGYGGC